MTLPQHLEPFTMEDNPSVLIALKHGRLPYTDETGIFDGLYYIHRNVTMSIVLTRVLSLSQQF